MCCESSVHPMIIVIHKIFSLEQSSLTHKKMDQFNGWEWFYLDDEAQNIGPFTTEELQGFYQNEQFTDETYGKERNFLQFLPLLPWTNPTPPFFCLLFVFKHAPTPPTLPAMRVELLPLCPQSLSL